MSDKIFMKDITLPIVETGENETYSFVQTDDDLETAGDAADAKKTGDEISALKQELQEFPNGNYPNMTAGNADQLVSTVFIEDEVPYNFRTSGGSADIGDREYDEIVGVSMPINQLANVGECPNSFTSNGITFVKNADNSFTANGTASNDATMFISSTGGNKGNQKYLANHVYYLTGCPDNGSGSTYYVSWSLPNGDYGTGILGKTTNTISNGYAYMRVVNGVTVNNIKFRPMLFDLTLMLGSAIAEYVYGLETATAGSGVTWLKHHFPKIFDSGYIPYNAGEMQSVEGLTAHKTTGFNQWDEQWESGLISGTTGQNVSGNGIRSKNMNRCIPNTSYYYKAPGSAKYVMWYDADENFISPGYRESDGVLTSPSNAAYFRLRVDGITTYSNNICLNLHWDGERDGQYEEYKEYEYALDDSVVLRGKLELDSNNNLRANGDRYLPDGTLNRRYGMVDLGTLTWYKNSDGQFYASSNPMGKDDVNGNNVVCSKYASGNAYTGSVDKTICIQGTSTGRIWVKDSAYTDAETFKTAMTGVKLVYELATATTETAEPYQTPQIVDDWGTEEYVGTSLVPVGHYTKYANNLRAKLEMAPESPAGNGDYIVRQTNGQNEYVALGSTTTIQGILDRLTALENA